MGMTYNHFFTCFISANHLPLNNYGGSGLEPQTYVRPPGSTFEESSRGVRYNSAVLRHEYSHPSQYPSPPPRQRGKNYSYQNIHHNNGYQRHHPETSHNYHLAKQHVHALPRPPSQTYIHGSAPYHIEHSTPQYTNSFLTTTPPPKARPNRQNLLKQRLQRVNVVNINKSTINCSKIQ